MTALADTPSPTSEPRTRVTAGRAIARPWPAALGLALLLLAGNANSAVPSLGVGNGVPPGFAPKDFAVIASQGVAHAFYIMNDLSLRQAGDYHRNERRFGHAISYDLFTWTFVDSNFVASGSGWDRDHVWAPSVVFANGKFWMFYTGVRDTLIGSAWTLAEQRIGVAWSTDLTNWTRQAAPLIECGSPSLPWADCAGGGARDPFVMREDAADPASLSPPGWLLYYTTKPATVPNGTYNPYAFVVGVARAPFSDPTAMSDLGPLWSTYRNYQVEPGTNKVESPHVAKMRSQWHLFFTGDAGVFQLTGPSALGDVGMPQSAWEFDGLFGEVNPDEYASETFSFAWEDGTVEPYLASLESLQNFNHVVNFRSVRNAGASLLCDPLTLEAILPDQTYAHQGDTVRILLKSDLPSTGIQFVDTLTRIAPFRVWEVDTIAGHPILEKKWPIPYGLQSVVHVTTQFIEGDDSETIVWRPEFVPDDDATPNRDELVFEVRGRYSPLVYLYPPGSTVDAGAPEPATPRLAVHGAADGRRVLLDLTVPADVRVELFDAAGRRVRDLGVQHCGAGRTAVDLDGAGREPLGPGLYFARATAGELRAHGRVIALR